MTCKVLAVSAAVAVSAVLALAPGSLAARATSLFASESNARSVCGPEQVVWVLLNGGKYFRAGSPGYAKEKDHRKGAYTCEKVARSEGGRLAPDGR